MAGIAEVVIGKLYCRISTNFTHVDYSADSYKEKRSPLAGANASAPRVYTVAMEAEVA
jgi:hypothetical protein